MKKIIIDRGTGMKFTKCRIIMFMLITIPLMSGCAGTPHGLAENETELLNEIMDLLDTTLDKAEKKVWMGSMSDSSMDIIVEELAGKQNYVRQVEAGQLPYDPELLMKTINEIRELRANIGDISKELEAEISFRLGRYEISDLPENEKEVLEQFVHQSADILLQSHALFPEKTPVIHIRSIGYADGTSPRGKLLKSLKAHMEEPLPKKKEERRQALNKALSQLRARKVSEYLIKGLETISESPPFEIRELEITGAGEEFPYSQDMISPPYEKKDERRRICKVYVQISIHIKE